jgi:hypothetical protein
VQPQLTIIALSLWLIVFLGLTCVVFSLISMWKENRFGWPLKNNARLPRPQGGAPRLTFVRVKLSRPAGAAREIETVSLADHFAGRAREEQDPDPAPTA